ncbi:MAG: hypothetical protein M2R45_05231 [Verrucomicrobia subdivision 3 bacterium]|nr:hypothetical protein [Limisphaerales bacterium]MCS1417464.1 hypothetical protein [Limisphaerales bacterium]
MKKVIWILLAAADVAMLLWWRLENRSAPDSSRWRLAGIAVNQSASSETAGADDKALGFAGFDLSEKTRYYDPETTMVRSPLSSIKRTLVWGWSLFIPRRGSFSISLSMRPLIDERSWKR